MAASAPTKLGRYEIVEELGKGAMGVVYLAKDPLIGRLVALKTFRIGYSAQDEELQQFRERFIREAQSAGILSHPNIVTIHDVVEASEEGVTFIAMEYVRGTNLKELLQGSAPLEMDFIVDVTAQVADALDFAHDKGVVHRDVKPANILITADRRVKIADFGIARLNTSNLTFDGQLLGTPNYMAPEQIQGKEVDHRADIFSLGVVLYELLTRKKPFAGDSLTVVTHRIVHEAFTPPEELVADLPEGLRAVLRRALEKDPERRFARASQMAEDLRKCRVPNLNDTLSTFVSGRTQRIETIPRPAPPPDGADAPTRILSGAPGGAGAPPAVAAPATPATPVIIAPPPLPEVALPPMAAAQPAETANQAVAAGAAAAAGTKAPAAGAPAAPAPAGKGRASKAPPKTTETTMPIPGRAAVTRPAPARPPAAGMPRWLIPVVGGLALVGVLVVAALWLRSRTAPPPPSLIEAPTVAAVAPSPGNAQIEEGRRLLAAGDAAGAVQAFTEAERLDPDLAEARGLRVAAEARVQADLQAGERTRVVDAALASARTALQRRRYDDARAAAGQVLLLLPGHPEASSLQAQAEQGLRRREGAGEPSAPAQPAAPATTPASRPAAGAAAPALTEATLALDFYTEVPKGSVTVYLNDAQLLRQSFKFARRTSVFRSEAQPGGLVERRTVPAGEARLRVIVALDGKPTRVIQAAGNLAGGSTHTLVVRVDAEGNATGTLQ